MITKKYRDMCEVYKIFAKDWDCDFSDQAMLEMFEYESKGIGDISISCFNDLENKINGYAVGKKWLNVTVSMWFEEINNVNIDKASRGWFGLISDLYEDKVFPEWFINDVFKDFLNRKRIFYKECVPEFLYLFDNCILEFERLNKNK